jgi:octaprenyl-diphosphate synthase
MKHYTEPIQADLKAFEAHFKDTLKSPIALLDIILRFLVKRKGKQLRPALVFLAARLTGLPPTEKTNRGAALVELMHTATLIHDDVVDDSPERRGFFSINALWKNKAAVLVGDYLLSRVLLLAVEHADHDLLFHVSTSVKAMSEGELLQLEKARRLDIVESVYYEIIEKKTASLMASCCAVGVSSVGADEAAVQAARHFGRALGMAFQIRDDLLDYRQYDQTGKPHGIDIKEHKMTLPLIFALQKADASERKAMIRTVKRDSDRPDRVQALMDRVVALGGVDYAEATMRRYRDEAVGHLASFPDNAAKEALVLLADFVVERKK